MGAFSVFLSLPLPFSVSPFGLSFCPSPLCCVEEGELVFVEASSWTLLSHARVCGLVLCLCWLGSVGFHEVKVKFL